MSSGSEYKFKLSTKSFFTQGHTLFKNLTCISWIKVSLRELVLSNSDDPFPPTRTQAAF